MSEFDFENMDRDIIDFVLLSEFSDFDPERDGDEERKLLLEILDSDFSSESVGRYGEHLTKKALKEGVEGYKRFASNVLIPNGDSKTEIDLAMIHEKGVVVIESKNYGGWIFGDEESEQWLQTLPTGEKHRFYNPIKQNAAHCKALGRFLGLDESDIYSYIVFSERCTLKEVPKNTMHRTIIKRTDILDEVKKDLAIRTVLFDESRIDWIHSVLSKYEATEEEMEGHKSRIKQHSKEKCPWCGKLLVERNGKYGRFIGCSGFPSCRYTRN